MPRDSACRASSTGTPSCSPGARSRWLAGHAVEPAPPPSPRQAAEERRPDTASWWLGRRRPRGARRRRHRQAHLAEAITQLRGLGLTPVLLTGDNAPAHAVAAQVGIDDEPT